MVAERRSLVFSDEELRQAFETFDRSKIKGMPEGRLHAAKLASPPDAGDITIALTAWDEIDELETTKVTLGRPQLAAILIHYCMRLGIPLPRAARKHVSSNGEAVVLNLALPSADANGASA